MLIVLCYLYLIMHVHIVQSEFVVRQIPFRGDGSLHTALLHLVEPPSACSVHSVDVDGVELPSPLLAEVQSIVCVISALV